MKNKRLYIILAVIGFVLLIPLIAMKFTEEVDWSLSDFLMASFLLFLTGLTCEVIFRKVKAIKYRLAICFTLIILLILIWVELAVGIFGTPLAGK